MELSPYVEALRTDLLRAVDATGPDGRALVERVAVALDPAIRMALMEALSDAAAEITQQLHQQAVEVRLKGREPQFVVSATAPPAPEAGEAPEEVEDGDAVARVTVRIPESLKAKAEEAAADLGQSLNTWIVQAIRRALRDRALHIDVDLGSIPFGPGPGWGRAGKRIQGWAR